MKRLLWAALLLCLIGTARSAQAAAVMTLYGESNGTYQPLSAGGQNVQGPGGVYSMNPVTVALCATIKLNGNPVSTTVRFTASPTGFLTMSDTANTDSRGKAICTITGNGMWATDGAKAITVTAATAYVDTTSMPPVVRDAKATCTVNLINKMKTDAVTDLYGTPALIGHPVIPWHHTTALRKMGVACAGGRMSWNKTNKIGWTASDQPTNPSLTCTETYNTKTGNYGWTHVAGGVATCVYNMYALDGSYYTDVSKDTPFVPFLNRHMAQMVAAHEIGHALGLAQNRSTYNSVMWDGPEQFFRYGISGPVDPNDWTKLLTLY